MILSILIDIKISISRKKWVKSSMFGCLLKCIRYYLKCFLRMIYQNTFYIDIVNVFHIQNNKSYIILGLVLVLFFFNNNSFYWYIILNLLEIILIFNSLFSLFMLWYFDFIFWMTRRIIWIFLKYLLWLCYFNSYFIIV